MKKVILLLLIAAVVFSCKKNEPTAPDIKKEAEVSFNVTTIFEDAGRDYDVPPCNNDVEPVFAKIKVIGNGIEGPDPGPETDENAPGYTTSGYWDVPVYRTDDTLYTQTIKFLVNPDDCIDDPESDDPEDLICCTEYTVTEFYLYGVNPLFGNPEYPDAEEFIIIKAAPLSGSEFQQFVENPLDIVFDVCAFEKIELYIDVLCFIPDDYQLFGFFWFEITEITVREICFFGDICIDWFWLDGECGYEDEWYVWLEYANMYQTQMQQIQPDMPTIFDLVLFKEVGGVWTYVRHESNYGTLWGDYPGEGAPLCIRYADYDYETDEFVLVLYVYGPWWCAPIESREFPFGFTYQGDQPYMQMAWYFTDDAASLDIVEDGVIEFAWGECVENPEWPLPMEFEIPNPIDPYPPID